MNSTVEVQGLQMDLNMLKWELSSILKKGGSGTELVAGNENV